MWKFLSSLPSDLSFILLLLALIAIVVISLRGHIRAIFGKKVIEIGSEKEEQENPSMKSQKRSCSDCILMMMGEREKFEIKIRLEADKVLKNQMNFVEQKLIEVQNVVMKRIINSIHEYADKNPGSVDGTIQHKLIYGLFKDALLSLKDETRRSLKENGFYDMDNSDFIIFVKDRIAIFNSILSQYIRNIFPNNVGVINPEMIIDVIESEKDFLSVTFSDIYSYSRSAKIDADNKITTLKEDFTIWIDNFTKNLNHEKILF